MFVLGRGRGAAIIGSPVTFNDTNIDNNDDVMCNEPYENRTYNTFLNLIIYF